MSPVLADLGFRRHNVHAASGGAGGVGLRLLGSAGVYGSTPDSVLNSVTGDIDIRWYGKAVTWGGSVDKTLLAKLNTTGNQRSYRLYIDATNQLVCSISLDGITSYPTVTSAGAVAGLVDGQAAWLRATVKMDNGAGNHVGTLYTSADGITWTQVATSIGGGFTGVASIFDSTAAVELGSISGGTASLFNGTVYYAEVRNGIDGPVVAKFDSSRVQASGAATPATIDGWTWNGAALYKRDDYVRLDGTDGNYLSFPDTAANSVTGDIDIRVHLDDDDTSTVLKTIISKFSNGQRSYSLRHNSVTANRLEFLTSADGSVVVNYGAAVDTPAGTKWVRVTRIAATGVAQFYTSPDGTTWSTLGGTISGTAGGIFDGTAPLEIGRDTSNTGRAFKGNVYYAEVRNGIGGPVVAAFNAADNADVTPWTINGSGWNWEGASFAGKPVIALSIPGTSAGGWASTPDTAGNSVTAALDVRAKIALDSWADGVNFQGIVSKRASGGQDAYQLRIDPTGPLTLVVFSGGSNVGVPSNTVTGFAPGSTHWVRATYVGDNGASGHTVIYYTSDDGIVWTPLGTAITNATVKAIDDTTAALNVGAGDLGTSQLMKGKVFYAEVRAGIDGPVVAKFDPTNIAKQNRVGNVVLAADSGFESGVATWTPYPGGTTHVSIASSTAQALDGVRSLAMTSIDGTAPVAAASARSAVGAVTPNWSYTFSVWVRAETTVRGMLPVIDWYVSPVGAYISSSVGAGGTDSNTGWTQMTVTGTAPSNATSAVIRVQSATNAATGETHYVDRAVMTEGGQPTSTVQPGGTPNLLTPNQASIETDATGWAAGTNATIAQDATQFLDGTKSLAVTAVAVGSSFASTTAGPRVAPGKLYTATAWFKAGVTGRAVQLFIDWYSDVGGYISTSAVIASGTDVSGSWTATSGSIVAPAGVGQAGVKVKINDATQVLGEVHYVDRISLVEAAEVWTMNGSAWDLVAA